MWGQVKGGILSMIFRMLLAALTFAAAPALADPVAWDLPSPYGAETFQGRNLAQFAADVATLSDGTLSLTPRPDGTMFEGPEIVPAVERGLVSAGEVLMSTLAARGAVFSLDSLPFLATDFDEAARLWRVSRPIVAAALAEDGLTLLYAVPWPGQSILSSVPVTSLEELRGRTLRAYNPATERLAQMIGAVPTEVALDKLPRAFESGRLAAMVTSPSTAVTSRAWEFAPHLTDTRAWLPKNIVVANAAAVAALSPHQRDALLAAAAEAEARGWRMARNEARTMLNALRAHGVTVHTPDAAMQADLAALGLRMEEWWLRGADDDGKAVLDAYRGE